MKIKLLLILVVSSSLSGCMSIAWIGYKKPIQSDFKSVNSNQNCMEIGVQSLNVRQAKAIQEAANDVCEILYSSKFKAAVISHDWLASCELSAGGKEDIMSGTNVYNLLMQKIPDYSVHARKPWLAIAQTQRNELNFVYNRVAIMPSRIEAWYSKVDTVKSELVNTIAHETTHIISNSFLDKGHGTNNCPNARLVSYGIGDLVEKIWLENHKK